MNEMNVLCAVYAGIEGDRRTHDVVPQKPPGSQRQRCRIIPPHPFTAPRAHWREGVSVECMACSRGWHASQDGRRKDCVGACTLSAHWDAWRGENPKTIPMATQTFAIWVSATACWGLDSCPQHRFRPYPGIRGRVSVCRVERPAAVAAGPRPHKPTHPTPHRTRLQLPRLQVHRRWCI